MGVTAKYQRVVQPFEPVYNKNSKVLILGSFPSVKSRELGFYYGHKQNRFWKVLAAILHVAEPVTVGEKKDMLLQHGIAVYDVIESCDIKGSSDSSIKNVVPADIAKIVAESDIRVIVTNGATAGRLFQKYQSHDYQGTVLNMPSTSPANAAFSLEKLIEIWSAGLKEYLSC
ncbi:MAG: DNA-deoxyinosine glycosylase [Clostridium sp.]|nr:DNA-deoxyinosine glycosylase [Clostridium sp.]